MRDPMCWSWPERLALLGLLGGCATGVTVVPAARRDLPAAVRAANPNARVAAGSGPTAVVLDDPRAEAEARARSLLDALARGDEDALRTVLAPTVEGVGGESAEGREQVLAQLRPWLPQIARALGTGPALAVPVVHGRDDCPPGACTGIFLRRGDWLVPLPGAGMLRPLGGLRAWRGTMGPGGVPGVPGVPSAQPPRFFVLRRREGTLQVVAVNDEFLR